MPGRVRASFDGDHVAADPREHHLRRHGSEVEADHEVEDIGRAASHQVGDPLVHDADTGDPLDEAAGGLPDAAQLAVTVGVGLARFDPIAADESRSFGNDHHRVPAGVGIPIRHHHLSQAFDVERHLGYEGPVRRSEIPGRQAGRPRVAPEEFHHGNPFVAPHRAAEVVDEPHRAGDRRREADTVLGPGDVVVHGLGNRNHGNALFVHTKRVRQGVVPPDGHQRVEAQPLDHPDGVPGQVVGRGGGRRRDERGQVRLRHPARVGPGAVQDRPPGPVDGPDREPVQVHGVGRHRAVVFGVDVENRAPAAPQTEHGMSRLPHTLDESLDDRVEPRNVASPGKDPYTHLQPSVRRFPPRSGLVTPRPPGRRLRSY